ncbi:MAG: hypothetical protein HC831_32000 [Chloroflexia bacterium]|nr:hypothetical protein [Chloroflexia bacterium]
MHDSNINNHLFLKTFLLFLVVFVFSASADFKKGRDKQTVADTELVSQLEHQANAIIISLPELPPLKVKWSFGGENNFLYRKPEFARVSFLERNTAIKYKSLVKSYLKFKGKA